MRYLSKWKHLIHCRQILCRGDWSLANIDWVSLGGAGFDSHRHTLSSNK